MLPFLDFTITLKLKGFSPMFNIIINTRFSATHCWPDCPIHAVSFLRDPHRHVFHVRMKKKVHHDNRDVEFIDFKNDVEDWLQRWDKKDLNAMSCEMMAKKLAETFHCSYVRVLEDGENGAEYTT